ncbi:hypothetical protein [Phyllobacterium sp. YR531]|uniref:hypothetical protein n=1 Tax=Phyllobacterium sp. YR531 TaxID=1144343 RepID=UPI00026F5B52|nr:hypothetical protein [Phyllobacterium sp. YR531]EJN04470.1 hypothetical protein PMI41_02111 [Phyllobacterium sp. YR531]
MIEWLDSKNIEAIAACVTIVGFFVIGYQIRLSRIASAHAALASQSVELRDCMERLGDHQRNNDAVKWNDDVIHLVNLLELTCAVIYDGMAKGAAGEFLMDSVVDVTEIMERNPDVLEVIREATENAHVYAYLYRFVLRHKFELKNLRVALSYVNDKPPVRMGASQRPWLSPQKY